MAINSMKSTTPTTTIKFLCSYGGKILPRHPDGKLRYHGGYTRVLAVDRSISFSELLMKLGEMCGTISVSLRCQLPKEDLDALISITSDEDLANLFQEYDQAGAALKIRAFISLPKSNTTNKVSPTSSINGSPTSNNDIAITSPPKSPYSGATAGLNTRRPPIHRSSKPAVKYHHPLCYEKASGKLPQYAYYSPAGNTGHIYFIHN